MASSASAPRPEIQDRSLLSNTAIDSWWLGIPRKLRVYSPLLSAMWTDGVYLTAWPRVALVLPLAVLLLGFTEGATHWSPLTIDGAHLSTSTTAVAFMQIFHLLFIAVVLGSMSAHLGLMLAAGFAAGEYLISGPFLTLGTWTPISGFFQLRLPLLYSDVIFLALAAGPPLLAAGLLVPLARRFPKDNGPSVILRVTAAAIIQMALVYLWVFASPMLLRVLWTWAHQIPPLSPRDYGNVLNPWLPLAAGVGVVARAVLVRRTSADQPLKDRTRRLLQETLLANRKPGWSASLPAWLRAVFTALALTLLLAGLIASWWLAALVCAALVGTCLLRNCVLPGLGVWTKWAHLISRVPLIFRLTALSVGGYFLTLGLLRLPGWGVSENGNPGHFEAELACFGVGLLWLIVLLPYQTNFSSVASKGSPLSTSPPRAVGAVVRILLTVAVLGTATRAHAICLDPACCFGVNNDAAFTEGIFFLAAGFLCIGGAAFLLGLGLEAAAAEAAAEMAFGDTALAVTLDGL